MTRFAIIQTASTEGSFSGPLVPTREGMTLWVRRIQTSKRRSTYGMREVLFSQTDEKALTWATRESAQKHVDAEGEYLRDARVLEVVQVERTVDEYGVQHLSRIISNVPHTDADLDAAGILPEGVRVLTPAPAKWGHINLPADAQMVQRFDVQVGDVLVSSHYGKRRVIEVLKGAERSHVVELRFEGHGDVVPNGTKDGYTVLRNERYDGDSLIPLLSKEI